MISFCTDSLHFVKKPRDTEGIHHFTLLCQILARYKQVLRHAGDPENQGNYKRRWIVGLTHCTSMDVLMLIAGAKYLPSETAHRIWGEQRPAGGEVVNVYHPAIFLPQKTFNIVGLRGSCVGSKGALSCLAVKADAFSTL